MGNPVLNSQCNPQWRLGMQPSERRAAYIKKQCDLLRVPYLEPQPELKLDAKVLVRMSSEKFAEFVVEFHRRVLSWDLKAFVYDNLRTPAARFFSGFLELQREADAEEEELFKNAAAAHSLATAPGSDESDAEDFLGLLAWMGQRTRLEDMRRLERIAKQKSRGASPSQAPKEWTIKETAPKRSPLDDIDLTKVESYYDLQIAKLKAEQDKLEQQAQAPTATASAS
jgi:hypothetical protein